MRKITTLMGWLFPLLLLATLTFVISSLTYPQSLISLPFLPHAILVVVVILGGQFGHSRLSLAALGYLSLLPLPQMFIGVSTELPWSSWLLPGLLIGHAWWLWRPDKGFRPLNLLQTLAEFTLVSGVLLFAVNGFDGQNSAAVVSLKNLIFQWFPSITATVSPGLFFLLIGLMTVSLVRVCLRPSSGNTVLFLSAIGLCLSQSMAPGSLGGIALAFAVVAVAAIVLDSYQMAFRDELTGIPSRRALMNYVPTLGRHYTVVMGDVDHFKKFNDTYGHDVGDQVLRMVASKLKKVSGGGRAFRYGGEEFTLIFAGKQAHQARPFIEAIREDIAAYQMAIRSKDRPPKKAKGQRGKKGPKQTTVHVTMSFGVAEKVQRQQDFMGLLKQADVALYQAKKAGRNCVV